MAEKPFAIGVIGGGNMARALISGWLARGVAPGSVLVAEPEAATREALARDLGVHVSADNAAVAAQIETLLLAVKPQVVAQVATGLAEAWAGEVPLIISIVAGTRCGDLVRWLGGRAPVIRVMPNTPALIGKGVSVLFAGKGVTAGQQQAAEELLRAVGSTHWVSDEGALDAVTAVSGSGPAYVFRFMEALADAGVREGLSPGLACDLAIQTTVGSACLAAGADESLATLRQRVTSPGGTTQSALKFLEEHHFGELLAGAVAAARKRAAELADESGSAT